MDGPERVGWRWLDSTATAHAGVATELDIVLAFSASPDVLEQGLTKGREVYTQAPQHGLSWQYATGNERRLGPMLEPKWLRYSHGRVSNDSLPEINGFGTDDSEKDDPTELITAMRRITGSVTPRRCAHAFRS